MKTNNFEGKVILVTGGTGSLGKVLVGRILSGEMGIPKKVIVFSRDEAKQHFMRMSYLNKEHSTDDIIYKNLDQMLSFIIGDVRDFHSVAGALKGVDVVINAAALKQVPACEYFPHQATQTNVNGPENIVRAIEQHDLPIETVIGVSTDKACKPVNVMGMTKAIQERIFLQANIRCKNTRFLAVRYGNVLASRGSVIPFFHEQIRTGGPVTITSTDMTRFLLSLDQAVDTIFAAYRYGKRGEMYIPRVKSSLITDIAKVLIGDRNIETVVTGVRPGEKIHEILISEEEYFRTYEQGDFYVIAPILPELRSDEVLGQALHQEFSSSDFLMTLEEVEALLTNYGLLVEDGVISNNEELLR